MTEKTHPTELRELRPGDHCWMLNGVRSRAFLCEVVKQSRADGQALVTVQNLDKRGQWFDFRVTDGKPVTGYYVPFSHASPTLVVFGDAHAQKLNTGRIHREFRENITRLIQRIPDEDLFDEVLDAVEAWQKAVFSDA